MIKGIYLLYDKQTKNRNCCCKKKEKTKNCTNYDKKKQT